MTNQFTPDEIKVMQDFVNKIKEEISKCPYPIKWFIASEIPCGEALYFSNMCPVCAVEDMVDWLEETQMQHLADHKEDDNDLKNEKIH